MNVYVGITDGDWYRYLSGLQPDEVNFWQPGGGTTFRALTAGELFLFKLHSPEDYIVGGGHFSHATLMPLSLAWRAFENKNGAASVALMRQLIAKHKPGGLPSFADPSIGCILLTQPFFFPRDLWISLPDWPKPVVRGRTFNVLGDGKVLWAKVQAAMQASQLPPLAAAVAAQAAVLGPGTFRLKVTDAYHRRCAITRSPVLPVLDVAEIKPAAASGPLVVPNGLLLRQDLHTLFKTGYITVTPDYLVKVSKRIKGEFQNGKEYYAFDGSRLDLPEIGSLRPGSEFIDWHNQHVYGD